MLFLSFKREKARGVHWETIILGFLVHHTKNTHTNSRHFSSPSLTQTHDVLMGPSAPWGTSALQRAMKIPGLAPGGFTRPGKHRAQYEAISQLSRYTWQGLKHWDRKTSSHSPTVGLEAQGKSGPRAPLPVTFSTLRVFGAFRPPHRLIELGTIQ